MAFDFTKQPPWVKVDPGPYYTITSTRITAVGMPRTVGLVANFSRNLANTLSGDFEFNFSAKMTASSATLGFYINMFMDATNPNLVAQNYVSVLGFCNSSNGAVYLQEIYGGYFQQQTSTSSLANNTEYWYTVKRVGLLMTCGIWSNSIRTALVSSLNLNLKGLATYSTVYLSQNYADGAAGSGTTYIDTVTLTGFSELLASASERVTALDHVLPPTGKWAETSPTFSAPSAVTITLDNLGNLATATSNIIDNSVTRYDEVELEIYSTYNGTKTEPCWLDIKILKSIDGVNFGTVDCCNLTLPALNFVNAAAQRYTARFKAPRWWKLVVINHTGGFLQNGGGGNAVSFIGINPVFVI